MAKKQKTKKESRPAPKALSQAAMERKRDDKRERITPRDAAAAANRYYNEISEHSERATIEEIEFNELEGRWIITLGFYSEFTFTAKNYKLFEVDAFTGEVVSMRIRRL